MGRLGHLRPDPGPARAADIVSAEPALSALLPAGAEPLQGHLARRHGHGCQTGVAAAQGHHVQPKVTREVVRSWG